MVVGRCKYDDDFTVPLHLELNQPAAQEPVTDSPSAPRIDALSWKGGGKPQHADEKVVWPCLSERLEGS